MAVCLLITFYSPADGYRCLWTVVVFYSGNGKTQNKYERKICFKPVFNMYTSQRLEQFSLLRLEIKYNPFKF